MNRFIATTTVLAFVASATAGMAGTLADSAKDDIVSIPAAAADSTLGGLALPIVLGVGTVLVLAAAAGGDDNNGTTGTVRTD